MVDMIWSASMGSSPHARGAPLWRIFRIPPVRIIPACAGSTPWPAPRARGARDHPRMRGEHRSLCSATVRPLGSSPHARGALAWGECRHIVGGIIPACAGSTRRGRGGSRRPRDHPSMRGEYTSGAHRLPLYAGSSPHARGARGRRFLGSRAKGIIPACAGSTRSPEWGRAFSRDHPRMRGEHSRLPPLASKSRGSSPHARGARLLHHQLLGLIGIIPACAGSTKAKAKIDKLPPA